MRCSIIVWCVFEVQLHLHCSAIDTFLSLILGNNLGLSSIYQLSISLKISLWWQYKNGYIKLCMFISQDTNNYATL